MLAARPRWRRLYNACPTWARIVLLAFGDARAGLSIGTRWDR